MEQKQHNYQAHDQQFEQQRIGKAIHRPGDQLTAIVHRDQLNPCRQPGFELLQPGFNPVDGSQGIFAKTHHHHTTDNLALAIEFGHTAT